MRGIEVCIGTQIKRNHQICIVELNQFKYIAGVLKNYGMEDCKPISTRFESRLKLIKNKYKKNKGRRWLKFFLNQGLGT